MKKYYHIFSVAIAAFTLAACSNHDEPVNEDSAPVAALVSAGIGDAETRAAGDEWDPNDCIGISGKSGNVTYANMKYQTSGDGSFSHVGGDASGIFLQTLDLATFSAYYPFSGTENSEAGVISGVKTDDQTKQKEFDFLFASEASASVLNPALKFTGIATFRHSMARLVLKIKTGDGFKPEDVVRATYSISGIKHSGTFNTATGETAATGDPTDDWVITAPAADAENVRTYDMILYPQKDTNISLKATIDGISYSADLTKELIAGAYSTYVITITKKGLSISGCTIRGWDTEYQVSGETTVKPTIGHKPMSLVGMGDFYFSDGSFADKDIELTDQQANACIGIVFYAGHHVRDGSDYSASGIGQQKCHGYVMALTDVDNPRDTRLNWFWYSGNVPEVKIGTSTSTDDWNGYDNCRKIHDIVAENSDAGWSMTNYPAALACETYGNRTVDYRGNPTEAYAWQSPFVAPENTSGWFLPSMGQLLHLYDFKGDLIPIIETAKEKAPSTVADHIGWFDTSDYFSSNEGTSGTSSVWALNFSNGMKPQRIKHTGYHVRAILAY